MVSYKELGLVNTREMFAKAIKGGYAIPAFNFNNMEQLQAIISACVEANSPVILQVSAGARKYANQTLLRYMAQGAVEYAKELNGGKTYSDYAAPRPRQFVRTVQELHRHGLLVGDDRRFVAPLR